MSLTRRAAAGTAFVISVAIVVGAAASSAFGNGTNPTLGDRTVPVGQPISAPAAMTLVSADATMAEPLIPVARAFEVALEEEGAPGDPKEASASFALFSWGSYVDTPVWVVTYQDSCIPIEGPARTGTQAKKAICALIPMSTLIDATTGTYVLSFAHSDAGYEVRTIG